MESQMLTSEIWTELASTHINIYKFCELTSKRLRTDFYTIVNWPEMFANWPETFAKQPFAKRLVGETTDIETFI